MLTKRLPFAATLLMTGFLTACSDNGSSQPPQTNTIPEAPTESQTQPLTAIAEQVQTPLGTVRGERTVDELVGVSAWIYKGIPYAAAPVGDLRWRAPQPPQAWSGVRDATQWPPRCPQGSSSMGESGPISEDCLYLNVVTAAQSTSENLPVMVFYHGGGLTTGTGNSPTYTHPSLASKGVVLVTVNSRLGPMGYLAHPALSAEDEQGVSGNYGTLDLKASLEWVRDNIAAFGGDPDNVTIFGESGGGTKTISMMASPLTEGLFHKAIVQSGSALVTAERSTLLAAAEATGERVAAALGVDAEGDVLAQLRAKSWQDIIAAAAQQDVRFQANVVVDGYIIPDTVHNLFANGQQHDVPLIVGANAGESMLQTNVPLMATLHDRTSSSAAYVYNFSQLPKTWRDESCVAFHGLELPYVFGSVPTGVDSETMLFLSAGGRCESRTPQVDDIDMRVADQASTLWAQFAKTGNPSVSGLVQWEAFSEQNNRYLDIGDPLTMKSGIESAYTPPAQGN